MELTNSFTVTKIHDGEMIECIGFRRSILSYLYLLYAFGFLTISLLIIFFIYSSVAKNSEKIISTVALLSPPPYIVFFFLLFLTIVATISCLQLYILLRPLKNPTLVLKENHLIYDNGSLPFVLIDSLNDKTALSVEETLHRLKSFTQGISEFSLSDIESIKLQVMFTPKRLSIKRGSKEIELVRHFSESDKIKLMRHIKVYYDIKATAKQ